MLICLTLFGQVAINTCDMVGWQKPKPRVQNITERYVRLKKKDRSNMSWLASKTVPRKIILRDWWVSKENLVSTRDFHWCDKHLVMSTGSLWSLVYTENTLGQNLTASGCSSAASISLWTRWLLYLPFACVQSSDLLFKMFMQDHYNNVNSLWSRYLVWTTVLAATDENAVIS